MNSKLVENSVVKEYLTVQIEGKHKVCEKWVVFPKREMRAKNFIEKL